MTDVILCMDVAPSAYHFPALQLMALSMHLLDVDASSTLSVCKTARPLSLDKLFFCFHADPTVFEDHSSDVHGCKNKAHQQITAQCYRRTLCYTYISPEGLFEKHPKGCMMRGGGLDI